MSLGDPSEYEGFSDVLIPSTEYVQFVGSGRGVRFPSTEYARFFKFSLFAKRIFQVPRNLPDIYKVFLSGQGAFLEGFIFFGTE